MTVSSGLLVDGAAEVEHLDDAGRAQVEVLLDKRLDCILIDLVGAEGIDHDGDRMCDADGVGQLDLAAVGKAGGDDVLGDVASCIGCTAVHLRRILARECTAAMACPAAVRVDDDLAARVALRSADDELARRIDEDLRRVRQEFCRDNSLDDMLDEVLADLFELDILVVLRRDDDRVDGDRLAIFIEHRDLRLAVRAKIGERAVLADLGEAACEAVCQRDGQRHVLLRLIRRIAEHHALIAGADGIFDIHVALTRLECLVDALRNVRGLLVERDEDAAGVGIEAVLGARVADFAHRLADDLRDVDVAVRRHLTDDVYLPRRHERLAGHAAIRVLSEDSIEDAVRDLVGHLVRMTLRDRFRGK